MTDGERFLWLQEHGEEVWWLHPNSDPPVCVLSWANDEGWLFEEEGWNLTEAVDKAMARKTRLSDLPKEIG